ncbi:MAG: hypothetical protein AAGE65_09355 [Planctomycetota bacterium]
MRLLLSIPVAALIFGVASPASAVVVDANANARSLLTPPASVIGTWGNNAAAVAIGPNHVITNRHQDGTSDTPALRQVVIDGVTYDAVSQTLFDPSGSANWDVRVVEIARADDGQPANLTDFVPIYTRSAGESLLGQRVVIAGPGVIGVNESSAGFDWAAGAGTANNPSNNFGINFGENVLDSANTQTSVVDGFNGGPGWVLDFDNPDFGGLPYEASVGPGDSGAGLLHFRYDQWWLVGLPNSVGFASGTQPDAFYGQSIFAFDLTEPSLVSQIESAIGNGFAFPDPQPLPEPASALALLGLSALALRRR